MCLNEGPEAASAAANRDQGNRSCREQQWLVKAIPRHLEITMHHCSNAMNPHGSLTALCALAAHAGGLGELFTESERGGFVMLERVDASYTVSHRLIL